MIDEFRSRKLSFDLFLQRKPLAKIEPPIGISDFNQLNIKNKFTFKIFTELCLISDRLQKKGIKPIVLGGFACALVTDNFYREHDDIDFGLVCDPKTSASDFYKSLISAFESFGYVVEDKKTFDNFFQFLLTDKEELRFELDVFTLKENRIKYFFEPTPTSPFRKFEIGKNITSYPVDGCEHGLLVPTVSELMKIKNSDDRPKGTLDLKSLEDKKGENLRNLLKNRHS